jgi:hypothetical protein
MLTKEFTEALKRWLFMLVSAMFPSPSPDLPGEVAPAFRWSGSDHLHRGQYRHPIGFPFRAQNGCEPLAEAGRTLPLGIVLSRASTKS